jgi:hypothetical protein
MFILSYKLMHKTYFLGFGAQAARLCGGGNHNIWEKWMPDELENETLLYAQAYAAVNHINFLSPEAYRSERWALKGQAIQAIHETLNDAGAAEDDGNIGAVLCMAVVAPLEVGLLFYVREKLQGELGYGLQDPLDPLGPGSITSHFFVSKPTNDSNRT